VVLSVKMFREKWLPNRMHNQPLNGGSGYLYKA